MFHLSCFYQCFLHHIDGQWLAFAERARKLSKMAHQRDKIPLEIKWPLDGRDALPEIELPSMIAVPIIASVSAVARGAEKVRPAAVGRLSRIAHNATVCTRSKADLLARAARSTALYRYSLLAKYDLAIRLPHAGHFLRTPHNRGGHHTWVKICPGRDDAASFDRLHVVESLRSDAHIDAQD